MPEPSQRKSRRIARAAHSDRGRALPAPSVAALAALAVATVLLLALPPESNRAWALNGFRSLPAAARAALVAVALTLGAIASIRVRARAVWVASSIALAATVAFPLREKIHFLGDSALRIHTMAAYAGGTILVTWSDLFRELHATPLDVPVNFVFPILVHRVDPSLLRSISLLTFLLALVGFAGVWRLTARLTQESTLRLPLALALVLAGSLEAFAGYAESAGLMLAIAPWWWAELLPPLERTRSAVRLAALWCLMILAHRMALVLGAAMLWRALGPALTGDRPAARRALLIAAPVAGALALAALRASIGPGQMGTDFADAFALFRSEPGVAPPTPLDALNLLALVAPLALLAPFIAGAAALIAWLRTPQAKLVLSAAIPLLPLALLLPVGPHGLGPHRDWDVASLCGSALTVAGAQLLGSVPAPRWRVARIALIPVLALAAGGWVAVNAHVDASMRRALALAQDPPRPAPPQLGALFSYLGQRAMDDRQSGFAAQFYEHAYENSPNPRFLLLAAEAWVLQGEPTKARRDLDRARASGGLNVGRLDSARRLEEMIQALAADSARAGSGPRPAGAP